MKKQKIIKGNKKADIRSLILKERELMTPEDVAVRSKNIHERLFSMKQFIEAKAIMAYASFRNEVDTMPIIERCLKSDKKVFLPLADRTSKNLFVYKINDFSKNTNIGSFGIPEPKKECEKITIFDEIDICLIPGIAFDCLGNRIGWGMGYYDSFLKNLPQKTAKYGLGYDFQLVEPFETTGKDVPIDALITESKTLFFNKEES